MSVEIWQRLMKAEARIQELEHRLAADAKSEAGDVIRKLEERLKLAEGRIENLVRRK